MKKFLILTLFFFVGCASRLPKSSEVAMLQVQTMEGKKVALQNALGDLTFITFWASWCKSCKLELDALNYLGSLHYHRGVKVLGISIDETQQAARAASQQRPFEYVTLLFDDDKSVRNTFKIANIPVTVVLDKDGNAISFPDPETGVESQSIPGLKPWGNALCSKAIMKALG